MFCFRARKHLIPYIEGLLDAKTSNAVARHIERCRTCAGELAIVRQASNAFRTLKPDSQEPSADLWTRIKAEISAPAPAPVRRIGGLQLAGAAVAAALILFAVNLSRVGDVPVANSRAPLPRSEGVTTERKPEPPRAAPPKVADHLEAVVSALPVAKAGRTAMKRRAAPVPSPGTPADAPKPAPMAVTFADGHVKPMTVKAAGPAGPSGPAEDYFYSEPAELGREGTASRSDIRDGDNRVESATAAPSASAMGGYAGPPASPGSKPDVFADLSTVASAPRVAVTGSLAYNANTDQPRTSVDLLTVDNSIARNNTLFSYP